MFPLIQSSSALHAATDIAFGFVVLDVSLTS